MIRRWIGSLLLLALAAGAAAAEPPRLSIVIDDLGQNLPQDRRVLGLPGPVTLAIMPGTLHGATLAREAHKAGRTVILHLPMDPAGGPFAWHPELSGEERLKRLENALATVPYVSGVNNHEGSRMTADRPAMSQLMQTLQAKSLFFLDSRTSAATVAAAEAQKIGLASLSRDVFLDNVNQADAIAAQLQEGVRLARKQGTAVLIGHPRPATLSVLERELPTLIANGIEIIDVEQMIALRSNRAMAGHGKNGVYR
ncbi:divergent polysaccharide deacetylase family protein [Pseudomonas sp. LTJR-52]|uniref:divergent polysaccharide deacetylase family protein n=1 Tax=Pseudomonas sp. LTJR-52 TaxID=2479392 RepID=UPI000EFD2F88|nr:divergent polysaccharide deacetylase family protein [Pseudomonas sp. LTJR-52]